MSTTTSDTAARPAAPAGDDPIPVTAADHLIGAAEAAVTVMLYGDYAGVTTRAVNAVVVAFADPARAFVRLVYRHLPDVRRHPLAYNAALGAETAGAQGCFAPMHERLMLADLGLGRDALLEYASDLGLDVARFERELRERRHIARIWRHLAGAEAAGITTAPAVFVDGRRFCAPAGLLPGRLERELDRRLDQGDAADAGSGARHLP